jgi:hypothetical protein
VSGHPDRTMGYTEVIPGRSAEAEVSQGKVDSLEFLQEV